MRKENPIKELFSNKRNLVKLSIDLITVCLGIFLALLLRFEGDWQIKIQKSYFIVYGIVFLIVYIIRKNGVKSWSYTNSLDILNLTFTNMISFVITLSYYAMTREEYARTVIFMGFIFTNILQLFWRFLFRLKKSYRVVLGQGCNCPKTLIYGAGEAGVALLRDAQTNPNYPYHISCIIDDDKRKIGTYINGFKVIGNYDNLEKVIKEKSIELVIIAIPTIKKEKIKDIIEKTKKCKNVDIKILPSINEILQNENMTKQLRDISIEDLLGREEVKINEENLKDAIKDKVIFVTGGAGSIGSELARQIAKYEPKQLILIDLNENNIYLLELELKRIYKTLNLVSEICSIREKEKLEFLFDKYKPNMVFHAAAHKHVPLMEHNPEEAIKNNIFGTKKVAECADKYGVERMVLISTDKAVNPTNLMGASKRACELVVEHMNKISKNTKFMAVRFGNVLGSSGSVIPIFKKLISEGKNLTLTHKDIIRYFMTIPEAAQLVIEAGVMGKGGEIFILDMGEPVKIMDLAKNMIKLSGANVGIDIIGLRPGEKLYEELLYDVNSAIKTENKKIFITRIENGSVDINKFYEKLEECTHNPNINHIKEVMKELVVSYKEIEY